MPNLRRTWMRVIHLLAVAQLVVICGTVGAYWLWQAPAVLGYGMAITAPLTAALAAAIAKFRWK